MKYFLIIPLLLISSAHSSYAMFTSRNIAYAAKVARFMSSKAHTISTDKKSSKLFKGIIVGSAATFATTLYWEKKGEKHLQNTIKKLDDIFESFYPGL